MSKMNEKENGKSVKSFVSIREILISGFSIFVVLISAYFGHIFVVERDLKDFIIVQLEFYTKTAKMNKELRILERQITTLENNNDKLEFELTRIRNYLLHNSNNRYCCFEEYLNEFKQSKPTTRHHSE